MLFHGKRENVPTIDSICNRNVTHAKTLLNPAKSIYRQKKKPPHYFENNS